jgi:hypothetical protein
MGHEPRRRLGYRERTMSEAQFDPEYVFSHHHATPQKLADYEAIHAGAKKFARVLLDHVPECEDRHVLELPHPAATHAAKSPGPTQWFT